MVVHMRHTRAHRDNRRSHHALTETPKSVCPKCKSPIRSHTLCSVCGSYNGKEIVDVLKKTKKVEDRKKRKADLHKQK